MLVEAALVTPIFLVLLLGAIEGGFAFSERLSVANMALVGARAASGRGNDVDADYRILQSVGAGRGMIGDSQITSIVVYKATGAADSVPAACKAASIAALCNRYVGADLERDATQFGCVGPPGPTVKIDGSWCPTTRRTALSGVNGPPDYIGVYVEATHAGMTGIFGDHLVLRSDTIIRAEPRTLT
ncbi:MAG: TadE/TadG family type IV pilus assembly protein [Acidimicrobiales bacterium]